MTNFIRWRYVEGQHADVESDKLKSLGMRMVNNKVMESNAKIVEWSDGTKSLVIGDKHFEIQTEPVHSTQCFANYKKMALLKGQVADKMIVKPSLKATANMELMM